MSELFESIRRINQSDLPVPAGGEQSVDAIETSDNALALQAIGGFSQVPEIAQSTDPTNNDTDLEFVRLSNLEPFDPMHLTAKSDLSIAIERMNSDLPKTPGKHRRVDISKPDNLVSNPETTKNDSIAVDETTLSLSGLKKYLHPIEAIKGYGRGVKTTIKEAGWADLAGTATAVGFGYYAYKMGGDAYMSAPMAFAAANGESLGFYGVMSFKEYRRELRKARQSGEDIGHFKAFGRGVHNNVKDLGPSELIDTVTRPLSIMAAANMGFANSTAGTLSELLVGKVIGDHPYFATMNASMFLQDHLEKTGRHTGFKNMSRLAIETVTGKRFSSAWRPAKNVEQVTAV